MKNNNLETEKTIKEMISSGKQYNQKLEYALDLASSKATFIELARKLGICEDLLDACREQEITFDDWLFAFGIVD